jgi:hypothetical protein
MTTKELTIKEDTEKALEALIAQGDLSKLTPAQRIAFYRYRCDILGEDPATEPFGYIRFKDGRLKLYAKKELTESQRKKYEVSIGLPELIPLDGCIAFRVPASLPSGRTDSAIGAVGIEGKKGSDLANAAMIAETKAKRRVTLSLLGLGLNDESEVTDVRGAQVVKVSEVHTEAKILEPAPTPKIEQQAEIEDDIPESWDNPPSQVQDEEYRITTPCTFKGKSLKELKDTPILWKAVAKVMESPALRRNLDNEDFFRLNAYGQFNLETK